MVVRSVTKYTSVLQTKPAKFLNSSGLRLNPNISCDTFVPGEKCAKTILLKTNINSSLKDSLLIGKGEEALVYRIKNTDFVVRIPHGENEFLETSKIKTHIPAFIDTSKIDFNISPRGRVNHVIATIGNAQILKYIPGETLAGIQNKSKSIQEQIKNTLVNLSNTSIKKYFLQLQDASKAAMRADDNNANCIIDPIKGTLTVIDFCSGRPVRYLETFMHQCNDVRLLDSSQSCGLLKKGLINLLEIIKDKKINPNKLTLDYKFLECCELDWGIKDNKFLNFLYDIGEDFKKDNSPINIDKIIEKIKNYS